MNLKALLVMEDTLRILESNEKLYQAVAFNLRAFLSRVVLQNVESVIGISTRVKSADSLREKIIRKKLYKRFDSGQEVLDNLSDLLGVRVECRFVMEEPQVFACFREYFSQSEDGVWYQHAGEPSIRLNLQMPQPQEQVNGHRLYRIDGKYRFGSSEINFELQIKSLVNIFWSEIEHKVIYKNNYYAVGDDFLKNLMDSINANLMLVDNQLMLIYCQMQEEQDSTSTLRKTQAKMLFAKILNDTIYEKMRKELGFTINFKQACNNLAAILLRKHPFLLQQQLQNQENTGGFSEFFEALRRLRNSELDFSSGISLGRPFASADPFCQIVGDKLLQAMNEDFEWSLFFKVLFIIEPEDNYNDFAIFLEGLKGSLLEPTMEALTDEQKQDPLVQRIIDDVLVEIAMLFVKMPDINMIYDETVRLWGGRIAQVLLAFICDYPDLESWQKREITFQDALRRLDDNALHSVPE